VSNTGFPIRIAAKRSGLSPHVIRVWEKRYQTAVPRRTGTNRRLYTEADVERLSLLRAAISEGHRIGNIANLPVAELRQLLATELAPAALATNRVKPGHDLGYLEAGCLEAIRRLDGADLEGVLARGLVLLGGQGLLQRLVGPLARKLGDLWTEGSISAAHEHFATAIIRQFLTQAIRPQGITPSSPCLVAATPAGQLHELGAVMVAAAATNAGWRVVYLGANLPAAEIAGVVIQNRAQALALSLVYPADDPGLTRELRDLGRYLPAGVNILVGGRAASSYLQPLQEIGATVSENLDLLLKALDATRNHAGARASGLTP
jgi:DNA-binding transcriptional MerR regulator/methylmalonyl-CoA mutase cobalamin-binding subunit